MQLNCGISSALLLVLAHTTIVNADDVIKIPITTQVGLTRPSTIGRWEHTLRKYGLSTDFEPNQRGGPQGRQRGRVIEDADENQEKKVARVPLVDFDFDREYYGTVLVGEPPQSFKIDFDTGSSRFILSSKGCTQCSGTTRYDSSLSTTFRLNSDDTPAPSSINTTSPTSAWPRYSSSKPPHDPNAWHITYGDLSHAEGYLGRDHVTLGASLESTSTTEGEGKKGGRGGLTVQHQELALVTSESANFDEAIDGIMGLAFGALSSSSSSSYSRPSGGTTPSKAVVPTKTVFENMIAQGLVDRGMFSFYLGKSSRDGGGEVLFGGWDPSRIEDGHELVFTNVTKPKYWQINVENVFVSDHRVDYTPVKTVTYLTPKPPSSSLPPTNSSSSSSEKRSNIAGIVDTGTTLMITPFRLANAIHAQIPYARIMGQSWAVPCNLGQTHGGAKVELQIEGRRFAIPFEDMVREPVERPSGLATTDESPSSSSSSGGAHKNDDGEDDEDASEGGKGGKGVGLCFSGVQPSGANFMIIGDVFIKNNYVVFDQEHQRVGIAPLKLADPLSSSSSPSSSSSSPVSEKKEKEKKGKNDLEKKKNSDRKEKKEKEKRGDIRMRMGWEVADSSSEEIGKVEVNVPENGQGHNPYRNQ
ncbi:acid protease [Linnemannia elongata AG-77]|uniref:Acid protease n=1 Tax=Linnemannia elongata AG-77 TaxID=1314771 RepID=A0A197JNL5_9FUNG|nr:acid protease [Linnemannia elongata AG-77]